MQKSRPVALLFETLGSKENEATVMIDLQALGITSEDLQERVVENVSAKLLEETTIDGYSSSLLGRLHAKLEEGINRAVGELAEKHVLPNVNEMIANLTLTKTSAWGEKKGTSVTLIEYLVERAELYMKEPVDSEGKSSSENTYGTFKRSGTRLEYCIHKHLHHHIDTAMKKVIGDANNILAGALTDAIKIKIDEIKSKLEVTVKTK